MAEEFGKSDKWKKYRKLFLTLAIIGVIGEQFFTIMEFALSEHLETIDEAMVEKEMARTEAFMEAANVYGDRHISRIISYLDTDRPITIETTGNDSEANELACELEMALKAMLCRNVRIAIGPRDIGGVTPNCIVSGVTIFCTDCPNGKDAVTGKLQAFLIDPMNNVAANVLGTPSCGPFGPKGVVILVGRHSLLVDASLFEAMPSRMGGIEEMEQMRALMRSRHESPEGLLTIPRPCLITPH